MHTQTNLPKSLLIIAAIAALLCFGSLEASLGQASQIGSGPQLDRYARSIANGNGESANIIDHGSSVPSKLKRTEGDRHHLSQDILSLKSIATTIIKFFSSNQADTKSASRAAIGMFNKYLMVLKDKLSSNARDSSSRSQDGVAQAGLSMLQAYVKSVYASPTCRQKFVCQASRDAAHESRELGPIISYVSSKAFTYLFDEKAKHNVEIENSIMDASSKGRSMQSDCDSLYPECKE